MLCWEHASEAALARQLDDGPLFQIGHAYSPDMQNLRRVEQQMVGRRVRLVDGTVGTVVGCRRQELPGPTVYNVALMRLHPEDTIAGAMHCFTDPAAWQIQLRDSAWTAWHPETFGSVHAKD